MAETKSADISRSAELRIDVNEEERNAENIESQSGKVLQKRARGDHPVGNTGPKVAATLVDKALYGLFTLIVGASVLVVIYGIAMQYAVLQVHPAVLYVVLILTLTLLGYVEALHYSNVAIELYDMSPYQER